MRDHVSWSLGLYRGRNLAVRAHASFLGLAVVAISFAAYDPRVGVGYGALALVVLFLSILAHELGHFLAASRSGSAGDQIVILPVGGLAQSNLLQDSQQELVNSLAGPAVNVVIWLLAGPLVMLAGGSLLGLLNPLRPIELFDGPIWAVSVKLVYWINWLLLLANALPAAPLDGVRIYRALLWPACDYRNAVTIVARAAQLLAIGFCLAGWFGQDWLDTATVPAMAPCGLLALFLFFSARQDLARLEDPELDDDLFSYDFSQGYTSLESGADRPRRRAGGLRGWLERRRRERQQRQLEVERDEERQVDDILARLHEIGIDSVTPKERALLERVSARFRNRQQS
jgi:Zn-dependent protease